jgi:hypothetical protein
MFVCLLFYTTFQKCFESVTPEHRCQMPDCMMPVVPGFLNGQYIPGSTIAGLQVNGTSPSLFMDYKGSTVVGTERHVCSEHRDEITAKCASQGCRLRILKTDDPDKVYYCTTHFPSCVICGEKVYSGEQVYTCSTPKCKSKNIVVCIKCPCPTALLDGRNLCPTCIFDSLVKLGFRENGRRGSPPPAVLAAVLAQPHVPSAGRLTMAHSAPAEY